MTISPLTFMENIQEKTMVLASASPTLEGNRWINNNGDGSRFTTPHIAESPSDIRSNTRFTSVIFDLGDVLFTYSTSSSASPISPEILRRLILSSIWFEYEKGNLTEEESYAQLAKEYNLSANDVARSFSLVRESLKTNFVVIDAIKTIKASGRQVFAMSNMSAPDWEVVKQKLEPSQWDLFDGIFISAKAHERKPHMGFYRHVLTQTGIDPTRTIFVDDKIENVVTARSFGIHGIVCDDVNSAMQQLRALCGEHIERAKSFLYTNRKNMVSVASNNMIFHENFSQLLIQEATGDRSLVDYDLSPHLSNFFCDSGLSNEFPDDLDTAAIALTVADVDEATKHSIMDEMLLCRDRDGLVQVYFDHTRPRLDPVVCVNVLTLFYRSGRGHELDTTLDWVYSCLVRRAYIDGTLYYTTGEAFLFFLSRLMQSSPVMHQRFKRVYRERVMERFEVEGDCLALSMRIIAAATVGLVCDGDVRKLRSMQCDDGSWTAGSIYRFGSSGKTITNVGLTTALAIKAIQAAESTSVSSRNWSHISSRPQTM